MYAKIYIYRHITTEFLLIAFWTLVDFIGIGRMTRLHGHESAKLIGRQVFRRHQTNEHNTNARVLVTFHIYKWSRICCVVKKRNIAQVSFRWSIFRLNSGVFGAEEAT